MQIIVLYMQYINRNLPTCVPFKAFTANRRNSWYPMICLLHIIIQIKISYIYIIHTMNLNMNYWLSLSINLVLRRLWIMLMSDTGNNSLDVAVPK